MTHVKPPFTKIKSKSSADANSADANSESNAQFNANAGVIDYSGIDFTEASYQPLDLKSEEAASLTSLYLKDREEAKDDKEVNDAQHKDVDSQHQGEKKDNNAKSDKSLTHELQHKDLDEGDDKSLKDDKDNKSKKSKKNSEPSLTNKLDDEDISEAVDPVERDSIKALTEDESFSQPKSYGSILAEEFVHARETFKRSNGSVFTSAIMAGLEIGISYMVLVAVYALLLNFVSGSLAIVLASLLYPIGFITVVIGQSLLYTEQTSLLSLPVVAGFESSIRLIQIWSLVILGNVVGGCLFSLTVVWLGLQMSWFDTSHINNFANHVSSYPWWIILASAIVAGWLMGLAAWLATSARDTFSRIVLVAIITACIGGLGLHHSIVGNIEIFAGLVYGTDTSLQDYLTFLGWALLGNTIGGAVFVTVLKAGSLKYDIDKLKEERLEELHEDWKRFH